MATQDNMERMRHLLDELIAIMDREGERNWIRGVTAARASLDDPDGERGLLHAQSIVRHMLEGKGAFSDYYIQRTNFAEQVQANQRLEEIRDELWQFSRP